MRTSIAGVALFTMFLVGGCGGGSGSSSPESDTVSEDAGSGSQGISLSLDSLEVTEGREFVWEVSIEEHDTSAVSIEWDQVSGVPVTILQGSTATLVGDAPFVAQPESVEMRVQATDTEGDRVEAVSTLTVYPYVPTHLDLTPSVTLPEDVLPYPEDTLSFSTALSDEFRVASDAERPMLVMASDSEGKVLLSVATRDGGLLGEVQGVVEFSIDSTALVLIVFAAGEAIPSLTKSRVADIRSLPEFSDVVNVVASLLAADSNFLERFGQYPDLQALVTLAAENLPPLPAPEGVEGVSLVPMSSTLWPLGVSPLAQDYGDWKEGFYCTPLTRWPCSPWNQEQPWTWFGSARGAEAFLPEGFWDNAQLFAGGLFIGTSVGPALLSFYVTERYVELLSEARLLPFLAFSIDNRSTHAFANPNFINYAMEAFSDGDRRFWRLTPRNSTMVRKLLNSGAAMRTEVAGTNDQLSPEIDRVVFQRYRIALSSEDGLAPDHAAVVSLFNILSLAVSAANLVVDSSAVFKALDEVDAENSANLKMCAVDFLAAEDLYVDAGLSPIEQAGEFILRYSNAVVQHMLLNTNCQNIVLKRGGKKLVEVLASTKIQTAINTFLNVKSLGGKAAFDGVNDFVPMATSFFSSDVRKIEYYIHWVEEQGQPHIGRVTTTEPPSAAFSVTQLAGPSIRVDASASSYDPDTTLSYAWGLVEDLDGNGHSVLGSGPVLEHTFVSAGTYIVELTVTDGRGLTDKKRSVVIVEEGRRPVIDSLSCNFDPDGLLQMRMQLSDPDQRATEIRWFADRQHAEPDATTPADVGQIALVATPVTGGNWARVEVDVASGDYTLLMACWTEAPRAPTAAAPLNDTGIDWCADGSTNFLTCPVAGYPGQDGEFGRDASARTGTLEKVGAGDAGFDYTKIANNGSVLPASATLGSGPNDWACTRDNVTGLIWEVKTSDGGLRDWNNTYTWYDPNSGGSDAPDPGPNCVNSNCDTTDFVNLVNAEGLCGASDWRMPSRRELQGIVDYGRFDPAIDPGYFPNTPSSSFWSGSPYANDSNFAWVVYFNDGHAYGNFRSSDFRVRLVRGGQSGDVAPEPVDPPPP